MSSFKFPPTEELVATLLDLSRPIAARMRSIFYLRTIGGDEAVQALCKALRNKEGTTLFRHEIAYVLGQMLAKAAVPDLLAVLRDTSDDPIVRHESGEALGAIADPTTLEDLDAHCSDARPEVAETCSIAARRVRWVMEQQQAGSEGAAGKEADNPYESVDPAPSAKSIAKEDIPRYGAQLVDQSLPLFERYKAMFSLRNCGSKAAVLALCAGFADPSPLFRHEVAYVLGQLQHAASVPALKARTEDAAEHEMVRHEAAEALGAIGTGECVEFLQKYTSAEQPVMLRESCEVALDVVDYWAAGAEAKEGEAPAAAAAPAS